MTRLSAKPTQKRLFCCLSRLSANLLSSELSWQRPHSHVRTLQSAIPLRLSVDCRVTGRDQRKARASRGSAGSYAYRSCAAMPCPRKTRSTSRPPNRPERSARSRRGCRSAPVLPGMGAASPVTISLSLCGGSRRPPAGLYAVGGKLRVDAKPCSGLFVWRLLSISA